MAQLIMDNDPLRMELKRVEKSYIELLDHTSTEIERLKLVIHCLVCIDENKEIPSWITSKMLSNKHAAHNPLSDITLFHKIQDKNNYQQQIEQLRESKIILIRSSSFEIDRLRTIIKYFVHKMKPLNGKNVFIASVAAPQIASASSNASESRAIYSWDDILEHNSANDLWLVYDNKIFDVSRFLRFHPGGSDVILEIAAKNQDITNIFKKLNHPPITGAILVQHFIGNVAEYSVNSKTLRKRRESWSGYKAIWDSDAANLNLNLNVAQMQNHNVVILTWGQPFTVKISTLDKQHENLVAIINRLYNSYELKDLQELLHRWDVHCKTEETLFFYYKFEEKDQIPHIEDHKRIYHKIKDQATNLRIKYNNEEPKCKELIKFSQWMADAFRNHHVEHDSHYVQYLHTNALED